MTKFHIFVRYFTSLGVRKIIFSTPKIIKSNFSQNLMWVTPIFIAEMDSAFKITTRQWISKHLNHKFRSQNTFSVWFWKFSRTGPKWSNSIEQLEPKFIQFTKKCCFKHQYFMDIHFYYQCVTIFIQY